MKIKTEKYIYAICLNPKCVHNRQFPCLFSEDLEGYKIKCQHCQEWNLSWKSSKGNIFFLERSVNQGSLGSVYRAWEKKFSVFEGEYAIKFFHLGREYDNDYIEREIKNLDTAYNSGARVPKYIDYYYPDYKTQNIQEKYVFIVQEYIEGNNLKEILESRQRKKTKTDSEFSFYFTEKEIFEYLIDILETLYLVHKSGVLHRDIKPANIIQKRTDKDIRGEIKKNLYLVDFGSSKSIPIDSNKESINFTRYYGDTPFYTPPETLSEVSKLEDSELAKYKAVIFDFDKQESLGKYKFSRDLYSLALTMFDLLSHSSSISSYHRYLPSDSYWNNWIFSIRERFPNLFPILERMSRFYPNERYNSALDVLLDISTEAWYTYGSDDWLLKGEFINFVTQLSNSRQLNNKNKKLLDKSIKKRNDDEINKIW